MVGRACAGVKRGVRRIQPSALGVPAIRRKWLIINDLQDK
jgi:hypothetical protein